MIRNQKLADGSVLVRVFDYESDEPWPSNYITTCVLEPIPGDPSACEVLGLVGTSTKEINKDIREAGRQAGFKSGRYLRKRADGKTFKVNIVL
jgi:hypothetical protein